MSAAQSISYEVCERLFFAVREAVFWLIVPLTIARCSVSHVLGETDRVKEHFRNMVLCLILLFVFPMILNFLLSMSDFFENLFKSKVTSMSGKETFSDFPYNSKMSSMEWVVVKFLEVLSTFIYYLLVLLHSLLMIVMSAAAPVVIVMATQLGIGMPLQTFFGVMVTLSCYPIFFYGIDTAFAQLSLDIKVEFFNSVIELLNVCLKIFMPVYFSKKAMSSQAGQAVMQSMQGAIKAGGFAFGAAGAGMGSAASTSVAGGAAEGATAGMAAGATKSSAASFRKASQSGVSESSEYSQFYSGTSSTQSSSTSSHGPMKPNDLPSNQNTQNNATSPNTSKEHLESVLSEYQQSRSSNLVQSDQSSITTSTQSTSHEQISNNISQSTSAVSSTDSTTLSSGLSEITALNTIEHSDTEVHSAFKNTDNLKISPTQDFNPHRSNLITNDFNQSLKDTL